MSRTGRCIFSLTMHAVARGTISLVSCRILLDLPGQGVNKMHTVANPAFSVNQIVPNAGAAHAGGADVDVDDAVFYGAEASKTFRWACWSITPPPAMYNLPADNLEKYPAFNASLVQSENDSMEGVKAVESCQYSVICACVSVQFSLNLLLPSMISDPTHPFTPPPSVPRNCYLL